MRLIDADALKKALHNFFDGKVIDEPAYILRDVFCHIDGAPTVELSKEIHLKDLDEEDKQAFIKLLTDNPIIGKAVYPDVLEGWVYRETPKGKWIFHKDFNESCRYGCNQCGNLTNIPNNFCPKCGAKMKKGTDIYGSN